MTKQRKNYFKICPDCKGYTQMIGIRQNGQFSYFSIGRVCFNCRTLDITNDSFKVKVPITTERNRIDE